MPSELFVSRVGSEVRAALREDGTTVELQVERDGDRGAAGQIFKGRVTRVLPGIQSAFIDIGLERDVFLHVADLLLPGEPRPAPTEKDSLGVALAPRPLPSSKPIDQRLREGQDLLVQITREGVGLKGARVTCHLSLAGRYLVYLPLVEERGISRRIVDSEERVRLKGFLESLPPSPGGFIVRTAGSGVAEAAFRADAQMLLDAWGQIEGRAAASRAPATIHEDLDLVRRLLRDSPRGGLDRVILDNGRDRDRAVGYLEALDPILASRVETHTGPAPLFETHGLDQDIEKALRPKVWLRSGGFLVIEQTEALVIVDVNTGKFLGERRPEDTVLRTNLEAAHEIARQLRLRDLGGIIVVDFIDMESPEHRTRVLEALEAALKTDRARTQVVGWSGLGLLQLTRKKTRRGLESSLMRPCPVCAGHGRVKAAETVALEALVEVRRLSLLFLGASVTVRAHPEVARAIQLALHLDGGGLDLQGEVRIDVEEDPAMRPDHFDVMAV